MTTKARCCGKHNAQLLVVCQYPLLCGSTEIMQPTTGTEFNNRVRLAHRHREAELNRDLGQAEIGVEMGKLLGTGKLTQATVSRYFRDTEPELAKICALATVLGVDCGWLAFGDQTKAPAPSWFKPPTSNGGVDDPARIVEQARRQARVAQGTHPGRPPRRQHG